MKRRICVVTGTRAEYGLLYWLMREIALDERLKLQLVVTGAHLAPEFGLTADTIEADGFTIDRKVEMLLSSDTPSAITKSLGLGTIGFADAFEQLRPDVVVILGDRYEILAAAQAAMIARIPIAHLHGGESTEAAIDEAIRHSVTKMSHLHFVAAESYRQRVIQLGEDPARVFAFGAPALDNLERLALLNRSELERALEFRLGATNFLVTYHPTTLETRSPMLIMDSLLDALNANPQAHVIFTKANCDPAGRAINARIDRFAEDNRERVLAVDSLGQVRYLSALRLVDAVIGNSSSGLIEAPLFGTPTVNIGTRQQGRLRGPSVIDTDDDCASIVAAISLALSAAFRETLSSVRSLYGETGVCKRIKDVLATVDLGGILVKRFHDLATTS